MIVSCCTKCGHAVPEQDCVRNSGSEPYCFKCFDEEEEIKED